MPGPDFLQHTDEDLWARVRTGDQQALGAIYEKYWETLYQAAFWHTYDEAAAKDIVQEVFLYCWQKRSQINVQHNLQAYLRAAVRFKVLNHLKSEQARRKYEERSGRQLPDITHAPAEMLAGRDLRESYHREVAKLPEKMRNIFTDSREKGLSVNEIASHRNLSAQTVKNQLSAALKKLRDGLGNFFLE